MLKCFLLGALPKQVRHCGYNWSESLRWRPLLFEPLKRSFFLTSVKFHSSFQLAKSWNYDIRRDINAGLPVVTLRRVAIIFFEFGVVNNFMQKF